MFFTERYRNSKKSRSADAERSNAGRYRNQDRKTDLEKGNAMLNMDEGKQYGDDSDPIFGQGLGHCFFKKKERSMELDAGA